MSAVPPARSKRRRRILALAVGVGLLLWLPIEDLSVRPALLFAAILCGLGAARLLAPFTHTARGGWLRLTLAGLLAGLAVTPTALFLIAFKSSLHGHPRPDFTPDQVTFLLWTAPVWAAGGLLVGLGAGLWRKVK